jgi:hypothetical protein
LNSTGVLSLKCKTRERLASDVEKSLMKGVKVFVLPRTFASQFFSILFKGPFIDAIRPPPSLYNIHFVIHNKEDERTVEPRIDVDVIQNMLWHLALAKQN